MVVAGSWATLFPVLRKADRLTVEELKTFVRKEA
jgi:septin family protein